MTGVRKGNKQERKRREKNHQHGRDEGMNCGTGGESGESHREYRILRYDSEC